MREVLTTEVPNWASGFALMVAFVVAFMLGASAITAAIRERDRKETRQFWKTFRFWLGLDMLWCVTSFYALFAFGFLRKPGESDLWVVLLTLSWGIISAIMFLTWAREDLEGRPDDD